MIWTVINRVFFPWDEFDEMTKFEKENTDFHKVGEDTMGITYESRTDHICNVKEEKKE